ncbi:hypothetical protein PUR61_43310 [Streptomyces sp. BE20]|uniref:hypothetical protein n=1 Tax=Streptomyces sp. BE20 TaxID=3002525 RepID=UPI002E7946AE|nr:hypothetical protein [Streptomyces sp. BE20]MEE1828948.1 hypothetical protein [Streptomyces sp. BE20]
MPSAPRPAVKGAALLLLAAGLTACSVLAVSGERTPDSGRPTVRPPREVLLSAAQRLDDVGGARVQLVEEGPAGRRSASGTVSWGAHDAADLTVTDELGTGRLSGRDGVLDLGYPGAAPKRAERADAESLDSRASAAGRGGWAGGWMTGLVSNPGGQMHSMALAGKLSSLGGEQLNGGTVAHYRGTASVEDFFAADEGLGPERLAAVVGYHRQRGVTGVGYDFWVAPGDRLLRVRSTFQGTAGAVVTTTEVAEPVEPVAESGSAEPGAGPSAVQPSGPEPVPGPAPGSAPAAVPVG